MDAKESRVEAVLTERGSDGGAKFAPQYDRSKCPDAGASAFKGETAGSRPCAVIGPDRVVPPARDCLKKAPVEPWLSPDPVYRRLPDYPHKMSDHKDSSRNISPRQTFQENMQRIIMPPGYNAIKLHDDTYAPKNSKLNMPLEAKYCDVPYNISSISSDQKHSRNPDNSVSNVNPPLMRSVPQGWSVGSVNIRPLRPYGATEVLQYPDYANCTGPRPVITRTHISGHEELQHLYPEPYYHESNIRFKPYPNIKERYPQTRYEYLGTYSNPYHPPHPYAHKYEIPKTMPPHTYTGYPPVPVKYPERVPEPLMEGYQRTYSQQSNYSVPIRNPVIHPPYRPVPGNHMQNKLHQYPPDGQHKPPVPNKLPYDPTSKMYLDYDSRTKAMTDSYYFNELPRSYQAKNTIVLPNYASANMHGVSTHPYYIKENMSLKNYDYARLKNMDPGMVNHSLTRLPPQFSPGTLAISPADSNASNETVQTHGTAQEDCGYASQSSVTSVRSIENLNRIPIDMYGRYDYRYGPIVRTSPSSKPDPGNQGSKSKKDIRQFISSWSEGDDENAENAKRDGVKTITDDKHTFSRQYEGVNNQGQLYVLGLVNVPSEELSKYEHIQKVSKLPENIKGYNSLELLNQFEEAIESSNINSTSAKPPTPRTVQMPLNIISHKHDPIPRALSPLDVEAKISQSVIHKEVGCNFEIKPCSPKMLNVEVATSMQTLLNERVIEKVANPLSVKSPIVMQSVDENIGSNLINKSMKYSSPNTAPSCKMINNHHLSESSAVDHIKTNYSLQDLESNSGVCLASLPRLDNDIELNFPEVNQQFINANKTDSVITTSLSKDLPSLDIDKSDNTRLKNATSIADYDVSYQFSPKMENETDFSRLSKYRKLKRNVPDDNGTELAKAQASRVDSVIIKNPDNVRSLEETNDNFLSGGYYRNDSQEFAMNLVSQAKNLKGNHQHEIDKMFGTSSSIASTSIYDETNNNPHNNVVAHKSGSTSDKSFNVIEDITRNIHVLSEDPSVHSKDLSNRYLEKATFDIPMNLSPQTKHSMVGADEDIKNNKSEGAIQQDAISNVKHRSSVEKACHYKNVKEQGQNICTASLDKTGDILISLEDQNCNVVSDEQDQGEQNKSPNIASVCSSTDSIKYRDNADDVCKIDHTVRHSDQLHISSINTTCNDQDSGFDSQNVERVTNTKITTKKSSDKVCGNDMFDKIGPVTDESHVERTNNRNEEHEIEDKIWDVKGRKPDSEILHVTKIKRKKYRSDVTQRKRCTDKTSVHDFDKNDKMNLNRKSRCLKKSSYLERKKSVEKTTHEKPTFQAGTVVSAEKNQINNNSFTETFLDHVKNVTAVLKSDNNHTATKNVKENIDDDAAENIKPAKSPDVTKAKMLSLGLPITASCFKHLSGLEEETKVQRDFPAEMGDEITNNSCEEHESTTRNATLNSDISIVSIENRTIEVADKILSLEQNDSLDYSKTITHIQEKTLALSDQDVKQPKEKQVTINDNFDNDELVTQKPIEKREEKSDVTGKCEELNPITRDNECQDIHIISEDIVRKDNVQSSEGEFLNDSCPKQVNQYNFNKNISYCRGYVSKELYSPRFQNLLIYDENSDSFSSVSERQTMGLQIIPHKIETYPYNPDTQNDSGTIMNTAQNDNESTKNGETLESVNSQSHKVEIDIEKVSKSCMSEEGNAFILDKKFDFTSAEFSNTYDSNNVDCNLNEDTNTEKNKISEKTSLILEIPPANCETVTNTIDYNDMITDVGILNKPVNCEETVTADKEIEKNYSNAEMHSGGTNNIETDSCGTNIIVIEETSMTQVKSNEESKFDSSDMKNYEHDKKIKSNQNWCDRPRFSLKRSLSDSALDSYDDDVDESSGKRCFMLPKKRKKLTDIGNINESHLLNIIQSSRRNSISTLANENFSFCILIDDNCIVAEENYEQGSGFIQLEDAASNPDLKNYTVVEEKSTSPIYNTEGQNENNSDTYITKFEEEKAWVDDVGCEETIETEDIAENIVIGEPVSPKDTDLSDYETDDDEIGMLNKDAVSHTSKVKHIYGDNLCTNDAQLVDALYRTPQMDVNKKLMDRESQITENAHKYYDSDSLEMLLAEPVDNIPVVGIYSNVDCYKRSSAQGADKDTLNKESEEINFEVTEPVVTNLNHLLTNIIIPNDQPFDSIKSSTKPINYANAQDGTVHSCESSLDNVFSYIHKEETSYTNSSSPEVSSTTSEEKNSSVLLKISNCKGSQLSEVKSLTHDKQKMSSCKLTENVYLNANYNYGMPTNRPLLTKAAQKYIPPIRESIPDLKVKLALPQQSLMKLQKNKVAKEEPKRNTLNMYSSTNNIKLKKEIPRKVKPKFEDVLKNIDKVQFQNLKEKTKKSKKYIPKVVIKKSENGSHYASTSTKETFNPDLTGRKWQPWVFIERNPFIDKMALRNKTRAVFSHRRKSYVLAEKFCKYKSISSAKFIISQPKINEFSTGNLKYTIKLKHTY